MLKPADTVSPVRPTTLVESDKLNRELGLDVIVATETFQVTGSFKFRAAYHLASNVRQKTILAASSGNFGQALAAACKRLGKECVIVMPDTSAQVKIEAVREYGATIDLIDTRQKSRQTRIQELSVQFPDAYVASAYDDPYVIAGNATLGRELAGRRNDFDTVIVPVGGGGLSSGVIQGLRAHGCAAPVWGAEPLLGNDAARSLRAGHIVRNEIEPQTIADGARTLSLGHLNWNILRTGLSGIIEVTEGNIEEAVRQLFVLANLKVEPTGALSLGALLTNPKPFQNQRLCCVVSGGNVDPAVFARMIQPTCCRRLPDA